MSRKVSPVDFYDNTVLPALHERLDSVFPAFGWRRDSRGWVATERDFTKTLPGAPRPDRVVCHNPSGFLVHGGTPTSWVAYIHADLVGDAYQRPKGSEWFAAVRRLAVLAGVDPAPLEVQETAEETERREQRERREALLEAVLVEVQNELASECGAGARAYLVERGFAEKRLPDLPVGLFPTRSRLSAALRDRGFRKPEIDEAGILDDGRFEGRLLFAWRDARGHLETFAARDLSETPGAPKYLNLGGSKPALFGLDMALRPGRENLVLVEGLVDVLALQERGMLNVAAIGGTTLAAGVLESLAEAGVRQVTLALDNDEPGRAGIDASLRNAAKGDKVPNVYVIDPADLEDSKDPDEFVRRRGLDAFLALVEHRASADLYRTRRALSAVSPDSPEAARREAVDQGLDIVGDVRGPGAELVVDDILAEVAERTGYSREAIAAEAGDHAKRRRRQEREEGTRRLLREGLSALGVGKPAASVMREVRTGLDRLDDRDEDAPTMFSVDASVRLVERLAEGRSTGWDALDRAEVRLHPGELALVAARTGHGKSAFLANLAHNALREGDGLVVYYSLEESHPQAFLRLVAIVADEIAPAAEVPWTTRKVGESLRTGTLWEGDRRVLEDALKRMRAWGSRLMIVDRQWSADRIAAHARTLAEGKQPLDLVLLDYWQRVPSPPGAYDRRDIEVAAVARTIRGLAHDVGVPVVAGAQLNRDSVKDKPKVPHDKPFKDAIPAIRGRRPDLHHLREGGEQEADLVIGLLNYAADYRSDDTGEKPPATTPLEVGTLKNRWGAVGRWTELKFTGATGRITE